MWIRVGVSEERYTSMKYGNMSDYGEALGLSAEQVKGLSEETRGQYQRWIIEGQNNTEAAISDVSPQISIEEGTPEYTFARNAVVNWALYKKRSKDGSKTKDDAKEDYKLNIEYLRKRLIQNRGTRTRTVSIIGQPFEEQILLPSQLYSEFY